MLEMRTAHIPVFSGMDEGTDPLNMKSGELVSAKNVRYTKDGSAQARPGCTLAASPGDATGGWGTAASVNVGEGKLVASRDRLFLVDGRAIHQYAEGNSKKWQTKSPAPAFVGTSRSVASSNRNIISCGSCVGTNTSGRQFVTVIYSDQEASGAWGGNVYARVFDKTTGGEVNATGAVNPQSQVTDNTCQLNSTASDNHHAQVAIVGTSSHQYVVAAWADQSSSTIYYRVLDLDSMAWGSEGTLETDNITATLGGKSNRFDIKPMSAKGSNCIGMVYQTTGFIVNAGLYTFTGTTKTAASNITIENLFAGSNVAYGFGISSSSAAEAYPRVWVTYGYDDGTRIVGRVCGVTVSTWATIGSPSTVRQWAGLVITNEDIMTASSSAVDPGDTTKAYLCYTVTFGYSNGNGGNNSALGHVNHGSEAFELAWTNPTTVVTTAKANFFRTRIESTPFKSGSRWYALGFKEPGFHVSAAAFNLFAADTDKYASTVGNSATAVLLELSRGLEDATFFPRQSYAWNDSSSINFSFFRFTNQYVTASDLTFVVPTLDVLSLRSSVQLVSLTKSDTYRYFSYSSDEGPYISCGLTGYLDARAFAPCGFTFSPGYLSIEAPAGGTQYTDGTSFAVVYEGVDNDGNVCFSEPSSILTTDAASLIVKWPGNVYVPLSSDGWDTINLKTISGGSFRGDIHAVLYGGLLSTSMYEIARFRMTPPIPGQGYWTTGGFVTAVAVTAQPSTAAEGKQFIYTNGNVIPDVCPPCAIGMAQNRGRLFVLDHTRRNIWFTKFMVPGERARFCDDFTLQAPFDVEAIHALDGQVILFGRDKIGAFAGDGPNDLGTGGEFTDIQIIASDVGSVNPNSVVKTPNGLMFQASNGQLYLLDRSLQVQFIGARVTDTLASFPTITSAIVHPTDTVVLFSASNGSSGVRLAYNYRLDRWSVDTVLDGADIISQAVVGSTYYFLTRTGYLYREDSTTAMDAGAVVPMEVVFASERPAGAQVLHRLRSVGLLGTLREACDATCSIAYDDASSYAYSQSFTLTGAGSISEKQFYPHPQLGRSYRIKITIGAPTGISPTAGLGIGLSGVALTIGAYQGANRLASGDRK